MVALQLVENLKTGTYAVDAIVSLEQSDLFQSAVVPLSTKVPTTSSKGRRDI